jgi:acetyl esterase/lipase
MACAIGTALCLAACGHSATDWRDAKWSGGQQVGPGVVVTRDVRISDVTTADVFAAVGAESAPVVIMFHGTEGRRQRMEPLAIDVARTGAVVVVPSWPVIVERPALETTEDVFFEQTRAAVCAVRFARLIAGANGGDNVELTVLGHSGGAVLGARVALVGDPPWPGIDCYLGVSSHVDRFIGTGGDYYGEYQYGRWLRKVYEPYDVFSLQVTNPDLEVALLHGVGDLNVNLCVSTAFCGRLNSLGLNGHLLYLDAGHSELVDPSSVAGRFVADQVAALIHHRRSMFDQQGVPATLTFDGAQCGYVGSSNIAVDLPLRLRLVNEAAVPVSFLMIGFDNEMSDSAMLSVLNDPPWYVEHTPPGVELTSYVTVEPGAEAQMDWVFVRAAHRWLAYCLPEPHSQHPAAGLMHAAAEISLLHQPTNR